MSTNKSRRSLDDRIEDQERVLSALKDQAAAEEFEKALKSGRLKRGKASGFRLLLRELKAMQKGIAAARRHEHGNLEVSLKVLHEEIVIKMNELLTED